MSEPRTRWARVRLVLFGGVDGFASVISAPASIFRGEERKGAPGRRLTQTERRNLHFAGIGGRSRCARARVSTLPHYALTRVKAQAFVRSLF
jgi:hypothetical protein